MDEQSGRQGRAPASTRHWERVVDGLRANCFDAIHNLASSASAIGFPSTENQSARARSIAGSGQVLDAPPFDRVILTNLRLWHIRIMPTGTEHVRLVGRTEVSGRRRNGAYDPYRANGERVQFRN